MCGRYAFYAEEDIIEMHQIIDEINRRYNGTEALSAMATGEIYPTNIVPVITPDGPTLMQWGFGRWDGKGVIINARSETAAQKSMFAKPLRETRCLIPASGYFEWDNPPLKKDKKKYYLAQPSGILYMAGLYRIEAQNTLPTYVVMTQDAQGVAAQIHDRMPVIVKPGSRSEWLARGQLDISTAALEILAV